LPVAKLDYTALAAAFAAALSKSDIQAANAITIAPIAKAFLSGGCFWGVEIVFDFVNGVSTSVSGYAGDLRSGHTYSHTHTHTNEHTRKHTDIHTHTHTHAHTLSHTHTYTHIYTHTHTHTHTHTLTGHRGKY
jgi:hypothetical protein